MVSKTILGIKWVKLVSTGLLDQQSELHIASQNHMVELKMHDHLGYMNIFLLIVENTACLEWQLAVILTYLVQTTDNMGLLSTNQEFFEIISAET